MVGATWNWLLADSETLLGRHVNQWCHRGLSSRKYNTSGVRIMDEDWDNLVILDACRYDVFEEVNYLQGELSERVSRGSATVEFLRGNIANERYHDTVYVTGNPQYHRHREELNAEFHAVRNVWQSDDTWNDQYGTVLPEPMVLNAIEASERYPHKRLIIHMMQPHYPFVSEDTSPLEVDGGYQGPEGVNAWEMVRKGTHVVSPDEIWEAYKSNLAYVLPSVEKLVKRLSGKTVVTSDHGNMFGERATPLPVEEWGHPEALYTRELVTVPWLELPFDSRKVIEVQSQRQVTDGGSVEPKQVEERLRSLGYKP